jgi:thymidylate kinase
MPMTSTGRGEGWFPSVLDGPSHDYPGRLLAIEGSDGSGKSRFVNWLTTAMSDRIPCLHVLMPGEHLRSYRYWYRDWNEPGDEPAGRNADPVADVGLALMGIGDRLVRQSAVIEPALRQGHLVICERFALTPLVFKSGPVFSEPLRRLFRPDAGILFDAPTEVLVERVSARADIATPPHALEDKRLEAQRFRRLAESNGYTVVDTSRSDDYAQLRPMLEQLLNGSVREEVRR